jgi:hypothetical protein
MASGRALSNGEAWFGNLHDVGLSYLNNQTAMSAVDPLTEFLLAPMSAFGGKADMVIALRNVCF